MPPARSGHSRAWARMASAAFVVSLALATVPTGAASQTRGPAGRALLACHGELERAFANGDTHALSRLVDQSLDYQAITERLLVVHWPELSRGQKSDAQRLITALLRARYLRHVERLRGYDLHVESEAPRGPGIRVVSVATRGNENMSLAYDMLQRRGRFRVVDIVVDGESMLGQSRTRFNHFIGRNGWDAFIARLEERLTQGEERDE